jgi:hypothetical protein
MLATANAASHINLYKFNYSLSVSFHRKFFTVDPYMG